MAIIASILWRRIDTPGHEACRLEETETGWRLQGSATFLHQGAPANLAYSVLCDRLWRTISGRVFGAVGQRAVDILVERDDDGSWRLNDHRASGLDHLVDLDLGFTPATNLLPLKRTSLPHGRAVHAPAAWLDFETCRLTELDQTYERRSERAVYYRAAGIGYEDLLELDPNGFVRLYPGLWEAEDGLA